MADAPETFDAEAWADQVLPYDGPHHPQAIVNAADAIGQLMRRLANATQHPGALPYPGYVYRLLGELRYAVDRYPQVLTQLAQRMEAFALDPQVTSADPAKDPHREAAAAFAALQATVDENLSDRLSAALGTAQRHTGPLSYQEGSDG